VIVIVLLIVVALALPVLAVTAVRRHYTSWYVYRSRVPEDATQSMRDEVTAAGIMPVIIIDDLRSKPNEDRP
jgi:hypothetical protein